MNGLDPAQDASSQFDPKLSLTAKQRIFIAGLDVRVIHCSLYGAAQAMRPAGCGRHISAPLAFRVESEQTACSFVSSLLLNGATTSQKSSLTQSAHSVPQVLKAYTSAKRKCFQARAGAAVPISCADGFRTVRTSAAAMRQSAPATKKAGR